MAPATDQQQQSNIADTSAVDFTSFGLDDRLLRAIHHLKYVRPTQVQIATIHEASKGNDIVARARTGSGKTAAYCLPILQRILASSDPDQPAIRALILVPTRELSQQVAICIKQLTEFCSKDVRCLNVAGDTPIAMQKPLLAEKPAVVVGTPSRILMHLEANNMSFDDLQSCVVDEADLILSFGYEEDVRKIVPYLPKKYQAFLMSATLSTEVDMLKKLFVRQPAIIKLTEGVDEAATIKHYRIAYKNEFDKFVMVFFIYKLNLIKGKSIIFVNDIDRSYKLKLYLEQFGIKSAVLNSELPQTSRHHILQEFNKGVFKILIATDEPELKKEQDSDDESKPEKKKAEKKDKKRKRNKKDKEYGVSRGVDFHKVAAVINFDFPTTVKSYTHRAGRTGRAHDSGMALSFASSKEQPIVSKVEKSLKDKNIELTPYKFDEQQIDGFRYRCQDAFRMVTKVAIREARLKEIKLEILTSEKLKQHFEENPKDLAALRHDKPLNTIKSQPHLKHIPDYLMPNAEQRPQLKPSDVTFHKQRKHKRSFQPYRRNDPLKTLLYEAEKSESRRRLPRK